jgi:phage tail sheath protein FI
MTQGTKNVDGGNIWAEDKINKQSKLIWVVTDNVTNSGAQSITFSGGIAVSAGVPAHCDDGSADDQATCEGNGNSWVLEVAAGTVGANEYMQGWNKFQNADEINVSLIFAGGLSNESTAVVSIVSKYMIETVAEYRKDCIAIVSPPKEQVVNVGGATNSVNNVIAWRKDVSFNSASSYGTLDGNYKYVYDVYSDTYRWIGFSGDIAGLCGHTDSVRDAWWSPGGLNRGQIKGVVKLAYQPSLAHRDQLYMLPNGINPIVSFPGQGTVLWGDRTLLIKPSAFDRINVRRLFIILEKAISISAKYFLFEFNNEFTRKNFVNMVNPYLAGIQARQGMYDFYVQCDAENNTGEVIDANQFVASMFIKPSKSINFITLNFVATKTGVDFAEVIGQV